jgi:hypothetical protein
MSNKILYRRSKLLKKLGSGRGVAFTANTHFVTLPAGATVKGLSTASAEMWFKPTGTPGVNSPIYYESTISGSGFTRFGVFQLTTGDFLAVARDTDAGTAYTVTYSGPKNNTWYHLAICYSNSTDLFDFYVNGVLAGSHSTTKGAFSNTTPVSIQIGYIPASTTAVRGVVDDFRLWTTYRTQSDIRSNMFREILPQAGLLVYYPIDNSSGNLIDKSGNGLHATLSCSPSRNISDSPINLKLLRR